jgi:hypothetical protein
VNRNRLSPQAEVVLRDLETKRDKCMAFGRELAEARRAHAYQAHAVHDPVAQRELADVAAAIALNAACWRRS